MLIMLTLHFFKWMLKIHFFLNGFIMEEVYVKQPQGFENFHFLNYIFKLKRTFYSLKEAPRAWYDILKSFLIDNGFNIDKIISL